MDANNVWPALFAILLVLNISSIIYDEFLWFILFFTMFVFLSLIKIMWNISKWFTTEINSLFGDNIEMEFQIKNSDA